MRGTGSTKFQLEAGQFKAGTSAYYRVIRETRPSESQCSVTCIGELNASAFIQSFGTGGDLMVELKLS